MALNDDDYWVLKTLKDKYSININGCLKNFLKHYLEQLEGRKINFTPKNSGKMHVQR